MLDAKMLGAKMLDAKILGAKMLDAKMLDAKMVYKKKRKSFFYDALSFRVTGKMYINTSNYDNAYDMFLMSVLISKEKIHFY